MGLSQKEVDYLATHNSAAMVTVGDDGMPKAVRVGLALVDGRLWSSGTAQRVRTERLRRDPRCTLYVPDPGFAWLALETTVAILDGADAPHLHVRLFRQMQQRPEGPLSWFGQELEEEQFVEKMVEERRLMYEFTVERAYGMY